MSLTARLLVHLEAALGKSAALDHSDAAARLVIDQAAAYGFGTGGVELLAAQSYSIPASGTQVIDLGALTDPLAEGAVFGVVKLLMLKPSRANPGAATLKPNGTNPWLAPFNSSTDVVRAEPGGLVLLGNMAGAGWAVVEDSADQLLLTNTSGAGAAAIDVMVLGIASRWEVVAEDGEALVYDDGVAIEMT